MKRIALQISLFLAIPSLAFAHGNGTKPHDLHELAHAWAFDPGVVIPLALSLWLYLRGTRKLWNQFGTGHGVKRWELGCFLAGWFSLVIALVSPLHPWGRVLFSAHMTQHEILMLVSAPLLVLSRPILTFLKAIPSSWARSLAEAGNGKSWQKFWQCLINSFVAWTIHAIALWMWHIPSLFEATLDNEFIHALQHISFFGTALLFWWAIIHSRARAMNYGLAVLYLFTTAMHSGALGALLTFAQNTLYPEYAETAPWWGLTAVQDQQLGGLIMWIPAGLVYVVAGLALFAGWMRSADTKDWRVAI
jgi:putative membrane protein